MTIEIFAICLTIYIVVHYFMYLILNRINRPEYQTWDLSKLTPNETEKIDAVSEFIDDMKFSNGLFEYLVKIMRILTEGIKPNLITKSSKFSIEVIIKDFLSYLFSKAKNKEEIIGDLLEQDEYIKESGYSNFKRIKNLLSQIFIIKLSLIKTKIENVFSVNRKIDKNN